LLADIYQTLWHIAVARAYKLKFVFYCIFVLVPIHLIFIVTIVVNWLNTYGHRASSVAGLMVWNSPGFYPGCNKQHRLF